MPGGAGTPPMRPSQTPRRLPFWPRKRATSRTGATSVRRMRKRGARAAADAAGADLERARHRAGDRRRDGQHDRSWRGRVDVEGARDDHRAAGAAEPELHPVEPVRGAHAGVGAAVPDHPHRRPGPRVDAIGDPPHAIAVAVDDGDGHLPGLLDLEGDPLDVAPAVAVGGEEARDARDLRHRVGALEALGDEERAEGRRHEQREDDTGEPGQRAGGPSSGSLVAADDDGDGRALAGQRLRLGVHRAQVGDVERAADVARLAAGVAPVEDRGRRALLVREVARRPALVAAWTGACRQCSRPAR